MRKLPLLKLALAFMLFAFVILLLSWDRIATYQRKHAVHQYFAERGGIMTVADSDKLFSIEKDVLATNRVSNDQLAWMLRLMSLPPLTTDKYTVPMLHLSVIQVLLHVQSFSPSQRDQLYSAAQPMVTSSYVGDRILASELLAKIQDKRGIPEIEALLNDPDEHVRDHARKALDNFHDNSTGTI